MPRRSAEISVYDYLDHRAFLGDYYVAQKARGRGFSYRLFSRRAGLRSPNHLKLVIEGQRRLTADSAVRYATAMRLPEDEASYFLDLVAFNHARTPAERADTYQRLTGHRGYRKAQTLDQRHAAYYSQWFIPAIREMAMLPGFRGEPAWIAERMVPAITEAQAAGALETLLALGLLTQHDDGTLAPAEWVVKAEDATRGVHLAAYHRVMLERAREALDLLPGTSRNLSALTLCTSAAGYERIVERVKRFRQELIALSSLDDEGTHVVHVGVQIFPLTRPTEAA